MAAYHFGSLVPSRLSREPQLDLVLGHGPLLPLTAQQTAAGDAATEQPRSAGSLLTSSNGVSKPPTPFQGARIPDQSRKRRARQHKGETGRRRTVRLSRGLAKAGENATFLTLAEGPTRAGRLPHIRVLGDTQLLLPRPPPSPRRRNAKLPATTATTATPRPSDGSYL